MKRPKIIVFGHEKGGTGKSTLTIHSAIGLKNKGFKVGVIDLDARQGTTIRFLNRREKLDLIIPDQYFGILHSNNDSKELSFKEDSVALNTAITKMREMDYIIIDTRGSNSNFTKLAVGVCDKLITPINDSVIDIDMLISIDKQKHVTFGPYTQIVWEQRKKRTLSHDHQNIQWYIIRNRVSPIFTKNTKNCSDILGNIASKIGCKMGPSINERVIYKETFDRGILVFDIMNTEQNALNNQISYKAFQNMEELIKLIES